LSNEGELIERAQAGDVDAFCALARTYERRIYALAFHYCRDREDAEDLSQEVWLKAYAALGSFRSGSTFYTWLRRITINSFLNSRRKFHPSRNIVASDDSSGELAIEYESTLQNQLVVEKVMQALSDVTPQQRLMFLLKHLEGMTYEEIASEMGCSLGTVKKSVSRTIRKLRDKLGVNQEPEDYLSCAATGLLR